VRRIALAALLVACACAPPQPTPGPTIPVPAVQGRAIDRQMSRGQAATDGQTSRGQVAIPTAVAGLAAAASAPGPPGRPPQARPTDPRARLASALAPIVAGPVEVRLVVEHLVDGARFEHGANDSVPSASVYKLLLVHELLGRLERGELRADDELTIADVDALEDGGESVGDRLTVRQAIEATMGASSNRSAFALMRLIGRPQLNARLAELGLRRSSVPLLVGEIPLPGSPPLDPEYAVTSPADLAGLLRLIATGQTLSPASRAELFRLLALEETVEPLRQVLAPETVLAKNGWLPGVRNVAALIDTPTGTTIVAAFVDADTDAAAEATVAQIGLAVGQLYGVRPPPVDRPEAEGSAGLGPG
jgi:beta-lactamase class A